MTSNPDFTVTIFSVSNNSTALVVWCHFQLPWMTPNPEFKVTPLLDVECLKIGPSLIVNVNRKSHTIYRMVPYPMILSDLAKFSMTRRIARRLAWGREAGWGVPLSATPSLQLPFITSDEGGGKCDCRRLSVCLDLDDIIRVYRCRDVDELINFWARSGS